MFKRVDPIQTYPNFPGNFTFGESPIRLLTDKAEWDVFAGDIADIQNISRYKRANYALNNEHEIDPSTFIAGVDFEWTYKKFLLFLLLMIVYYTIWYFYIT